MLYGMTDACFSSDVNIDYKLYVSKYLRVVLAKFVCAVALHFSIYPHLGRSLNVMKVVVNNP